MRLISVELEKQLLLERYQANILRAYRGMIVLYHFSNEENKNNLHLISKLSSQYEDYTRLMFVVSSSMRSICLIPWCYDNSSVVSFVNKWCKNSMDPYNEEFAYDWLELGLRDHLNKCLSYLKYASHALDPEIVVFKQQCYELFIKNVLLRSLHVKSTNPQLIIEGDEIWLDRDKIYSPNWYPTIAKLFTHQEVVQAIKEDLQSRGITCKY